MTPPPSEVPDPTGMFTDFFLYDMVRAYVKAAVSLNYNTYSLSFPGGDATHLKPEDGYFDEAGGKYVWTEGLNEESCKAIYAMLGKDSKHAQYLRMSGRTPISRPGDLVTVCGAEFTRNHSKEGQDASGTWVNEQEEARQKRMEAMGWRKAS